jgi:hypothetical protein
MSSGTGPDAFTYFFGYTDLVLDPPTGVSGKVGEHLRASRIAALREREMPQLRSGRELFYCKRLLDHRS